MLCAILGLLTRMKTLVHLHDIPYRASERAIWRFIAAAVQQVVVVSRPCYPAVGLPAKVAVVHNGIAMPSNVLPEPVLGRTLRLGFVGRFHPNKGLDLLLDWFVAIRKCGAPATLTIRGRPDPDRPEYWEAIKERIQREGLADCVEQGGWVTGAATYAGIDMLLVPSRTPDPLPLVVPEAMSAGVVVAGYAAGGIPEMIEDGVTGLLGTDADNLPERIAALWADPSRFDAMRNAAHAHVLSDFAMERFHHRLLGIYQEMLNGRPSGSVTHSDLAVDPA